MIKQFLKKIITKGTRSALRNLALEFRMNLIHLTGLFHARRFSSATDLKLHLGCGSRTKEGWVNIDLSSKADLRLDLREPLPFPTGSCWIIYSQHFFEHLDYPQEAMALLREAYSSA